MLLKHASCFLKREAEEKSLTSRHSKKSVNIEIKPFNCITKTRSRKTLLRFSFPMTEISSTFNTWLHHRSFFAKTPFYEFKNSTVFYFN